MTQQTINIGSAPNDGTGDELRVAFDKTNQNVAELYAGAGAASSGLWNFDATGTDTSTAPVSGRFKTNSGNYRTATQIAIHATTIQGVDRSYLLRTQLAGDIIQCQDSTNSSAWCRFILQSNPVDNGTWFQLSVASEVDGGVASGNNQEIIIVCTANNAGTSGGGNVSNSGTPTSGQLAQWTDATHIQGIAASSLNFAPINNPTFTGDPKAPTPTAGDNDTSIATTAFVTTAVSALNIGNYAPLASPTFTGDPKAPTPATADNDTSIATTAYVKANLTGLISDAPSDSNYYERQNAAWVPAASRGAYINKFRNPGMDIAQRGTGGTVSLGAVAYTVDGWVIGAGGAAATWFQQYNGNLSTNALRIGCATGFTSCTVAQRIESSIAVQLLKNNKTAQPVTVQFTIYNASGATLTPQISTFFPTAKDNFGAVTTDLAATNLQSIPNNAFGTVAYTLTPSPSCQLGYGVNLLFGNALNAASGYVDISYADIRATPGLPTGLNNNPPPVELRPIQQELAYCQRYYYDPASGAATTALQVGGYAAAGAQITAGLLLLPVQMRATPTVVARNQSYANASALALTPLSTGAIMIVPNIVITATGNGLANFNLTASAEL